MQESHSPVLPGRLEAKREGAAIETQEDRHDAPVAGEARHVPPPEVPGPPSAGPAGTSDGAWPQSGTADGTWSRSADARTWPEAPPAGAGHSPGEGGPPPVLPVASDERVTRPKSKAARPGEPFYLPRADWRWAAAIAGLVAGAAPQALLQLASIFAGGTPSTTGSVTTASAIAIALSSLVLYSWQALAAWLFSLRSAGRSLVLWGFRRPTRAYFWVVPGGLIGVYAVGVLHDVIVHPKQQAIVSAFPHTAIGAAMFVLVAVVMAPVFEEILFRGFLFRGLSNSFGWVWGAVISSAIFGAAHMQLDVFLPLAALGFVLAWAYHRTGSLWTNITMHALFNTIAVLAWAFTARG